MPKKSPFNPAASYEEISSQKLTKERAVREIINTSIHDGKISLKNEGDLVIITECIKREEASPQPRTSLLKPLKAKLKKLQPQTVLDIKVDEIKAPDIWQKAKSYYSMVQRGYKFTIACQVMVGFQLINIKKELGYTQGGARKSKSADAALFNSFEEHVTSELGIPKSTAYVFIKMALGAKTRLKNCYENLPLLDKPFTDYSEDQLKLLDSAVHKITDGETQKSLIDEWKFSKDARGSAAKGGALKGNGEPPAKKKTTEQLAFAFITPTFNSIAEMRLSKKYKTYLHTLPVIGDAEAEKPGLVEVKAQLESMAKEIGEVIESRKKETLSTTNK